jgi:hypothetical protein
MKILTFPEEIYFAPQCLTSLDSWYAQKINQLYPPHSPDSNSYG